MFLWRSLTPAAIASVAAALTRAKQADKVAASPTINAEPSRPIEGIAKN